MNYLAIDYGLSKLGLAVSEGELAEPFAVIKITSDIIDRLKKLCGERKIEKIIVGLPEGELGQKVRHFGQKLTAALNLPVAYQDETLTSRDALAKMIQAGRGKKFRQQKEDAVAAAIILQNYLDNHV